MKQEYIIGDVVMYNNKIMVIKEPRDGIHFNLFCPEEKTVYCYVGVEDIKPMPLTSVILEKNGWEKDDRGYYKSCIFLNKDGFGGWAVGFGEEYIRTIIFVHQLQHLLFGLGINHKMEV
jgi:hypothetical protein